WTHDSIALGEDGPTHQPVEQLASLRAMPNLIVLRPADANETVEAWGVALRHSGGPVGLVLTRQKLPVLDRSLLAPAAGTARGAYVLCDANPDASPELILIATGSEVSLALAAHRQLSGEGVRSRVVSMPSWELFESQSAGYRDTVLPPAVRARVSVEAASPFGWERYVGPTGAIIAVDHFGASAPGPVVMAHFGFTVEHVVEVARAGLPALPHVAGPAIGSVADPASFPAWLRIAHYVNFLFLVLLIRSGLQILMDHPRLYRNVHCTPGTEWLRLTPIEVPRDRVWTSKEDSRHLSHWIGLPGGRHTVGMARHWHFLSVLFWVGNGLVFAILLFATGQWRRLVPTSWHVVREAWTVCVRYVTLHPPPDLNGFFHYNALQQLTYFGVVFVLAPLALLTGLSMSPALTP